jgi:hypothetical protein
VQEILTMFKPRVKAPRPHQPRALSIFLLLFIEEPSKRVGSSCSSLKKNRIDPVYKENWTLKPYKRMVN